MTRRYGTVPSDHHGPPRHDHERPEPEYIDERQRRRDRYPPTEEEDESLTGYVLRRWSEADESTPGERGTAWRLYLQAREASDG